MRSEANEVQGPMTARVFAGFQLALGSGVPK